MIYIVFYDYSINGQTTSGNPLVEAEFVQQVTNDNSATEYSKSVAISTSFWYPLLDSKKGIIYIFGNNQRIYKYRKSRTGRRGIKGPSSGFPCGIVASM
jgi:hypothetical protein